MTDIIVSLVFETMLNIVSPVSLTEEFNKFTSEISCNVNYPKLNTIQYAAVIGDGDYYLDANGKADSYICHYSDLQPTVNFNIIDSNYVNHPGTCNADTVERIGRERISRPLRLFTRQLLNPIDTSLGLFQANLDFYGLAQTHLIFLNESTSGSIEIILDGLKKELDKQFDAGIIDRDFSNVIIAGTFLDSGGIKSSSHAAVLTIDHKHGRLLLMEPAGINGNYQIADPNQNGVIIANPEVFGNLAYSIYCLNEVCLQSEWSCGYWAIEYVRVANRKKSMYSFIMDDVESIPTSVQPRLRPAFFQEVYSNILKIDQGLEEFAISKYRNDNPQINVLNDMEPEVRWNELGYIRDNKYYLLESEECFIFHEQLKKLTERCFYLF